MKSKLINVTVNTTLVIIMTINIVMIIRIWLVMNTGDAVIRENKSLYILPDGFSPEKTKNSWDDSFQIPSGWVIRYTSKGCIYCALDYEWERLYSQLKRLNYRIIFLLPKENDRFDDNEINSVYSRQIAYVKMDWIKQFRFTGTPTVVIFDHSGQLLWHNSGMLKKTDYESAEKAVIHRQ